MSQPPPATARQHSRHSMPAPSRRERLNSVMWESDYAGMTAAGLAFAEQSERVLKELEQRDFVRSSSAELSEPEDEARLQVPSRNAAAIAASGNGGRTPVINNHSPEIQGEPSPTVQFLSRLTPRQQQQQQRLMYRGNSAPPVHVGLGMSPEIARSTTLPRSTAANQHRSGAHHPDVAALDQDDEDDEEDAIPDTAPDQLGQLGPAWRIDYKTEFLRLIKQRRLFEQMRRRCEREYFLNGGYDVFGAPDPDAAGALNDTSLSAILSVAGDDTAAERLAEAKEHWEEAERQREQVCQEFNDLQNAFDQLVRETRRRIAGRDSNTSRASSRGRAPTPSPPMQPERTAAEARRAPQMATVRQRMYNPPTRGQRLGWDESQELDDDDSPAAHSAARAPMAVDGDEPFIVEHPPDEVEDGIVPDNTSDAVIYPNVEDYDNNYGLHDAALANARAPRSHGQRRPPPSDSEEGEEDQPSPSAATRHRRDHYLDDDFVPFSLVVTAPPRMQDEGDLPDLAVGHAQEPEQEATADDVRQEDEDEDAALRPVRYSGKQKGKGRRRSRSASSDDNVSDDEIEDDDDTTKASGQQLQHKRQKRTFSDSDDTDDSDDTSKPSTLPNKEIYKKASKSRRSAESRAKDATAVITTNGMRTRKQRHRWSHADEQYLLKAMKACLSEDGDRICWSLIEELYGAHGSRNTKLGNWDQTSYRIKARNMRAKEEKAGVTGPQLGILMYAEVTRH
ncbi:hypothetical protein RI367_003412 [Sorochytrium milnesiophthora]